MPFYLGIFNKLKITKICFNFNFLLHVSLNSCAITTKTKKQQQQSKQIKM